MNLSQLSYLSMKEYDKKIAIAIFVVFLCLFIIQLYGFLQPIKTDSSIDHSKNIRMDQKSITGKSPLFTISLFGDYVPVNLADEEIKQSMLDLEIVGIIFATQEKNSQVIIRAGGGEEKIYQVGDTLPGGAVIKRIRQNGVLVLHDGALESLRLPKFDLHFEVPAKPLIEE